MAVSKLYTSPFEYLYVPDRNHHAAYIKRVRWINAPKGIEVKAIFDDNLNEISMTFDLTFKL
jgi:hypothetical protein